MIYVLFVLLICLLFGMVYSHYLVKFDERRQPEGDREINKTFKRLVKEYKLNVYAVDRFEKRLIAIDRTKSVLLLVEYKDGRTTEQGFQLEELLSCRVVKSVNNLTGYVQKVGLELIFQNNHVVHFQFFDDQVDSHNVLNKRWRKAQQWRREIQFQWSLRQGNAAACESRNIGLLPKQSSKV
jgi:hypothetical protein